MVMVIVLVVVTRLQVPGWFLGVMPLVMSVMTVMTVGTTSVVLTFLRKD